MTVKKIFFNRYFDKNRLKALILWSLTKSGEKTTIDLVEKLKDLGFNFNYYTNISTTKTNNQYVFCYEYGYLLLENEWVLIVKNKKAE